MTGTVPVCNTRTVLSPCINWPKVRKQDGRAMIKRRYAYRVLWEEANGPLPQSTVLHHLCENKACVNLEHLEPTTQSTHMKLHLRGGDWGQAQKTHCPAGHEYTAENTAYVVRKDRPNRNPERHCRQCMNDWKKANRLSRKKTQ